MSSSTWAAHRRIGCEYVLYVLYSASGRAKLFFFCLLPLLESHSGPHFSSLVVFVPFSANQCRGIRLLRVATWTRHTSKFFLHPFFSVPPFACKIFLQLSHMQSVVQNLVLTSAIAGIF